MNQNKQLSSNEFDKSISNDEIDLRLILNFLVRNKILIGFFGLLFFALSYFYALTLKRIWKGDFQIVLDTKTKKSSKLNIPIFNENTSSNLKTQVGILRSPSVLMSTYEFVAKEKKFNDDFPFSKWEDSLSISLEKGTSILNISYKDTNKELIIPVLKKISLTYQDYSGRNIKREQEKTKFYLSNQISYFKEKSAKSLKLAQEYSIDQNLLLNDASNKNAFLLPVKGEFLISNLDITTKRIKASDKIRFFDSLLKKIQESNDDYKTLEYLGSIIDEVNDTVLVNQLDTLNLKLLDSKLNFREKDKEITRLLSKRDSLLKHLKIRTIGILNAKKLEAEAQMEAALRPKGVVLRYKELVREAQRDETTLISLENQLRLFELEQAKLNDPWELITQPTLLKEPVGPSRKRIVFFGFILGILIGMGIAFYNERKSIKEDDNK